MDASLCAVNFQQAMECWGQTVTENPRLLGLKDLEISLLDPTLILQLSKLRHRGYVIH